MKILRILRKMNRNSKCKDCFMGAELLRKIHQDGIRLKADFFEAQKRVRPSLPRVKCKIIREHPSSWKREEEYNAYSSKHCQQQGRRQLSVPHEGRASVSLFIKPSHYEDKKR